MTPAQWQIVKQALDAALRSPTAGRAEILDRECGDDAVVRAQVERLLAVEDNQDDDFLEPPGAPAPTEEDGPEALVGQTVGGYRVVRLIAAGGMGAVYEAVQNNPRRKVALKVIHAHVTRPTLLRRFELEAQLLGRLQHPGIAAIHEAGTFDVGAGVRPFFSMEMVRGQTLVDHAEAHELTMRARIALLARVCDAVHHAHQKGIVHRDLKPANIMVPSVPDPTRYVEPSQQPKVLDFGIARLTVADRSGATTATEPGELVGTLRYMSPEQLDGHPDDVDLRCDVYALGVIGYELLSGRLPYELGTSSFAEISRGIVDREPIRLSSVIRSLRGDIETILHTALRKDRNLRYPSAAALGADLRRFLRHEPIAARPLTAMYQWRTFARRNPILVGVAATAIVALSASVLLYAREAGRAREAAAAAVRHAEEAATEADRADAVSRFIVSVLARVDPNAHGQSVNVAQLVEEAAAEISTTFADQPLTRAAVHDQVGTIYYNLGLYDQAREQYEAALTVRGTHVAPVDPDHPDLLAGENSLGLVALRTGRIDEAIERLGRALEGRRRVLGDDAPQTLVTMSNLAMALEVAGRLDDAVALLRDAIGRQSRVRGDDHPETLATTINLASLCRRRGDLEEAERLHRRALAGMTALHGPDHVATLVATSNLAGTLKRRESFEEAESLYRCAVEGLSSALGHHHPDTLTAMHNRAQALLALGRADDAVEQAHAAVEGFRAAAGPQPDALFIALKSLGRCLRAAGRDPEADAAFHESLEGYRSRYGPDDRRARELHELLANVPE